MEIIIDFLGKIDMFTSGIMIYLHDRFKPIHESVFFKITSIGFLLNLLALSQQLVKILKEGSSEGVSTSMFWMFIFLQGMAAILAIQAVNFWAMISYTISMFISGTIIYLTVRR